MSVGVPRESTESPGGRREYKPAIQQRSSAIHPLTAKPSLQPQIETIV